MIDVIEKNIHTIPSLMVVHANNNQTALPTVVYFHGFTSAKEHNLPIAYLLAKKGFRVILPDSIFHGERIDHVTELNMQLSFWDIVLKNVEELKEIKKYLEENNLLLHDQLGVAGTSMGGITTSAALTKYSWVKAAAILMGSPKILTFADELISGFQETSETPIPQAKIDSVMKQLQEIDLSHQMGSLNERPLFLWHGENDQVVPFNHAYQFYTEAKKYYNNEQLIQFSGEENRDHKVSRPAILQTVQWFVQHLK